MMGFGCEAIWIATWECYVIASMASNDWLGLHRLKWVTIDRLIDQPTGWMGSIPDGFFQFRFWFAAAAARTAAVVWCA